MMKKTRIVVFLTVFLLAILSLVPSSIVQVDAKTKKDSIVKLIPGGESIGVKLNTAGVVVVGYHFLEHNGTRVSPSEMAKIKIGDIITHINEQQVMNMHDVKKIVNEAGKEDSPITISIVREKQSLKVNVQPMKGEKNSGYQIGLFVRDSATGIGTLTFIEPYSKKYGALGHIITDVDTKKAVKIKDGQLFFSKVTSIERGQHGKAGEKLAELSVRHQKIGTIEKNSPFGIFGKIILPLSNEMNKKPLPVARAKEGKAKILTVIEGEKVEAFHIEIVNVTEQKVADTKGMVIKITDPRLLDKTGGIIQGMSGSPIIQDDHIVGAVTHVFVNDPSSGYGVHIDWMIEETTQLKESLERKAG